MSDWNPALYLRFASERTRPAAELLARVPLDPAQVRHVVDLGCGPGNSTGLLVQQFVHAHVVGVDNSAAMLATARAQWPQAHFVQADIAAWSRDPALPAPDLIYANAALQWVGAHEALIPRLFAQLAPGGVLAVQMPDNLNEPSHRLMRDVAGLPQFASACVQAASARADILSAGGYYNLLAGSVLGAAKVDLWRTIYQHPMASVHAIVEWLRSTGLRPFLDALPVEQHSDFVAEYAQRLDAAYPAGVDGQRLLAFPRLFFVAQRLA